MEEEFSITLMGTSISGNGNMINLQGKGLTSSTIKTITKDLYQMASNQEEELIFIRMETSTKDSGKKTKRTVKGNTIIKTEIIMKVNIETL